MNIFGALPKKTLLLVLVLSIVLAALLFFLFFRSGPAPTTPGKQTQPTIPALKTTPATQKIPTFRSSLTGTEKPAYDIVFRLPDGFTLPSTIEKVEVNRELSESYLSFLKSRFGVSGNPIISGSTYYWASPDQKKSLQVDIASGYVQYGTGETHDTTTKVTVDQAKTSAEQFLKGLNIVSISPNTATVTMFAGEGEPYETQNPTIASSYEVTYLQSFKGVPIYYHFATPATISVFVDAYGSVKGFRYFNIQPMRTTQTTLLSLESVKDQVLQGDYALVRVDGNQESIPRSGTITVTKATAVHFDDKKSPSFFPTILLEGILEPSGREVSLYFSVLK